MDDAYPNPHQIDICKEKVDNKQMGDFWRTLVNLRESNRYIYQDCVVEAGNDAKEAVLCIRNYLTRIDADNVTLANKFQWKLLKRQKPIFVLYDSAAWVILQKTITTFMLFKPKRNFLLSFSVQSSALLCLA